MLAGDGSASERLPTPTWRHHPRLPAEAERRLYAAPARAGAEVQLDPPVDGDELGLAVTAADGGRIDVGVTERSTLTPRGRQRRQDLVRDLALERLRWLVLRIPAWRCLTEPRAAADGVAGLGAGVRFAGECHVLG
jgi:hypothetical protein